VTYSKSKVAFKRFFYTEPNFASCPGFSQDRVNFHQKPGGDTARLADPNWPNKTGY